MITTTTATTTARAFLPRLPQNTGVEFLRVIVNQADPSIPNSTYPNSVTSNYYLRSSVLGGRVITELNASGQKQTGYVYLGQEVLARQTNADSPFPQDRAVIWRHEDPITGARGASSGYGFSPELQPDPLGVDVGFADPYSPPSEPEPQPDLVSLKGGTGSSNCRLDGIEFPCSIVGKLLNSGSAAQCPNNDCSPRNVYNPATRQREWRFFQAFADGFQGFVPFGATSDGQGGITLGNGNEGWGYLDQSLFGLLPQNTIEKPFSASDLDAIRGELSKMLTKRCQDFIDKLLTRAGESGGDAPVKTSILDLFDMVRNQRGFVSATLEDRGVRTGYSTGLGAVGGAKNAKVLLSSTSDLYRQALRISYHAFNALSELTHVAGSKESGYYTGAFSDVNLAKVARDLALEEGGYPGNLDLPTVDPKNDPFGRWSSYYHRLTKHWCKRNERP